MVDGEQPLAATVVPIPSRTSHEIEVRRIPPPAAVFGLLAFPRVYGWRLAEVLGRDLEALSGVVRDVPVYEVTVPWGPPFDPAVAASLAALVTCDPVVPN